MKRSAYPLLASLISLILLIPLGSAHPEMDILTFTVITTPAARAAAMITGTADVWPSLSVPMDLWSSPIEEENGDLTPARIAAVSGAGAYIAADLGFHVGAIVYNIRADQGYRRTDISYWPLHDAEFRHALIHCYDQLAIIPPIYGYVVTPVRSLVPPAQSKYYNTAVEAHPYNPGDPFTSPSGEHSTCGILKAAGYSFVDANSNDIVDPADYWKTPPHAGYPTGRPLPQMAIDSPPVANAPAADAHVAAFIADLSAVGLRSTFANGLHGFTQAPGVFNTYLSAAYNGANFDAFFACYGLDKIPDQLYSLLHTDQDSLAYPGRRNAPGINDATINALTETVKFSFDTDDIETAAKDIQDRMYDSTLPNADNFALAYMCMYSRSHFNAYNTNLEGIIKSGGYGTDNKWTFLNINWATAPRMKGTETQVIWMLPEAPSTFNPLDADTKYEWEILARVYDGLTNENPYNLYDIPWLAADWTVTETATGMKIDFTLRNDVTWHDGYPFTASDVEFCLELLRDWQVPRYAEATQTLDDVIVTDATHFTVNATEAGLALFYDFAGLAAMLPPQIWDRTWPSQAALLAYDPTAFAYGTDMAPGYYAGPWAADVPTNLFGTGPWIFQFWAGGAATPTGDLNANTGYFLTTEQKYDLKQEMFWEVGDYTGHPAAAIPTNEGIVNVVDLTYVSFAFGSYMGDPDWDVAADFNENLFVGIEDLSNVAYHLMWQREYP